MTTTKYARFLEATTHQFIFLQFYHKRKKQIKGFEETHALNKNICNHDNIFTVEENKSANTFRIILLR
jgi:hypothetical protein